MKILTNLDLVKNQLVNSVVHLLQEQPQTPQEGQIYYNTTSHRLFSFNGTSWVAQDAADVSSLAWANITDKPSSTVSDIDDAVSKKHSQNTDTGTTSQTFQLNSGSSGLKLKDNSGVLEIRNQQDNAFQDLKIKDLLVMGSTTTINSNEVNIGDSEIFLNSDITASGQNSDGGIQLNRLKPDDTTPSIVKIYYDNTNNRWKSIFGATTLETLITQTVQNKIVQTIGDGEQVSFTVTHNFNTRDVSVSVRQTNTPYEIVLQDVEATDQNSITVKFAIAPTSSQYTVTVIG